MTKKELIKQLELKGYIVFGHKNLIHIHSSTETGRLNHKYLCSLEKEKNKYRILNSNYTFTNKIDKILQQIKDYLLSLEYDSEYFYPSYNDGIKEELYTTDYLTSLGFKSNYNSFTYTPQNIYGGYSNKIVLQIVGLSDLGLMDTLNLKEIEIILWTGEFSWVTVKAKRDFKSIKQGIDSMLKPLLVTEGISLTSLSEKLEYVNLTILEKKLTSSLDIIGVELKDKLKRQLTEILNKL